MVISLLLQSLPDLDRHEQFQKFSFPTTLWLTWSMPSSVCHFTRSTPFERPVGFEGTLKQFMTSFFDRVYVAIHLSSLSAMIVNIFLAISYDLKYSVWKASEKPYCWCPLSANLETLRRLDRWQVNERSRRRMKVSVRVFFTKKQFLIDRVEKFVAFSPIYFNCNAHFNEERRNILHEPSECEG